MRLQVKNLTYVYMPGTNMEQIAVHHVSAEAGNGEFIGLIGQTGSGKSTLMQLLNGLLTPTEGQVLFDGRDIHESKENLRQIRQKVGYVFQYPEHQLFESTVFKDVAFGPGNLGLPEDEIKARVTKALLNVGISTEDFEKSPFELSGGEKRRVAIAGVLAMSPEVLILDEPAAGLDPKGKKEILYKIKTLHRQLGLTIILVSHSMEDISRLAEKIWVMYEGGIRMTGTPSEIFADKERLEAVGLSLPQSTAMLEALKRNGWQVNTNCFTAQDVSRSIAEAIRQLALTGEGRDK